MTSAYSSMDPGVVSSIGQYDMHAAAGRSMMLHSPPPHFAAQPPPPQQQPAAASHRQSPSTPLNAGAYPGHHPASQLAGYGAPGPGGGGAAPGYMVAGASTPGVSPGAAGTSTDAPAKRDRDSIYGFVALHSGQSNLTERQHRCCIRTVQSYSPGGANMNPT